MNSAPTVPLPPYATLSDLIRGHARNRPASPALVLEGERLSYAELDLQMDRVAASLQL